ncbi:sulfatase [Arthrobacter sp. BE255]|uniref:sulfatase family protein n=1 Tax=Arthrobacter sp. BE255 TaxID=2817721 RepID=UPI00285DC40C|nr:sulfatase [Arthrobacter sp. BE255]MDR7159055.1 putative sulfatase [Arthrobacter sp. BE255]
MKPPNIVWISTHDINPDLGCYRGIWPGAEDAVTPNLDRLAAEGARYDNAFASAPVCAPARSAIMTGCFPTAIGTMHMRSKAVPPPEVRLLPEYFREAGYYCTNNEFTDFQVATPPTTFNDCSSTAHWRNRPDPETPFFAAFHGMATHESRIYYADKAFAETTRNVPPGARHDPAKAPLPPYHPDTPVFRRAWARYSDLITEMDHWVGGLLAQLEEDGLAGSTMVVFWSDHGPGMPRAKRWPNEAGLREPLIVRWPGTIRPGTVRTELVHTMDLAPTMLAASGLPVPAHMHGNALFDRNGRFDDGPNQFAYAGRDRMDEAEDTSRTVRDARYRYIRHYHPDRSGMQHLQYADGLATWAEFRDLASREAGQLGRGLKPDLLTDLQRSVVAAGRPAEELYDVRSDPHETVNLADNPDHEADLQRLRSALADWQERYGDLGMLPERALIEQWRPGGKPRRTEAPDVWLTAEGLMARCATAGSSVGWTIDPPGTEMPTAGPLDEAIGAPPNDGRRWNLYTAPIQAEEGTAVWVRAWRLGFEPSHEVSTTVSRATGPDAAAVTTTGSAN